MNDIDPVDYICPHCGESKVTRRMDDHEFKYGQTKMTVKVPVFRCERSVCTGPQWMNWESEEIMEEHIAQWKLNNK